ncbi:MAG: hypothetical protein LBC56_04405 [Oscillospiraceae bacterium]|nr:hypothetical protein [Oscillospiraceae bacterium]
MGLADRESAIADAAASFTHSALEGLEVEAPALSGLDFSAISGTPSSQASPPISNDNRQSTLNFYIYQAPGADADEVSREIANKIAQAVRKQATLL